MLQIFVSLSLWLHMSTVSRNLIVDKQQSCPRQPYIQSNILFLMQHEAQLLLGKDTENTNITVLDKEKNIVISNQIAGIRSRYIKMFTKYAEK